MAAGGGKENIQRSDTNCWGRKAVNAEDHMTIYVEEPAYRRCKTEYAQRERERERERERKNITIFLESNSYNLEQPTFTKGYKVTLYSD